MLSFIYPAIGLSMFMLSFIYPAIGLSMFMLSFIYPAIVLSMFMLSFIFVIICGIFEWKRICVGFYTLAPRRGRGVYCFTFVRPSIQDIFRRIFLSNCWWQKSDIWSQASYTFHFKYFIDKSIGLDNRLCLYKSSPTTRWYN